MEVEQSSGMQDASADGARRKASAHYSRAKELHGSDKFDDAAREYAAALAEQPDHAEVLHLYGVLQFQRGNQAESEALLRRAAALASGPDAVSDLGAVLAANGKADEAVMQLDRALQFDRNHVATLVRRARTRFTVRS